MAPESRKLQSVDDLKAFTHPLRLRLYYALTAEEAATASRLAEVVDESVSLVSYHLHQLAARGLIQEAPDRGRDGRERWWTPASRGFSWAGSDFADAPEGRIAAVAVKRQMVAHELERLGQWIDTEAAWGPAWTDAAFSSDSLLHLTASELDTMHDELQAVLTKWNEHGRSAARNEGETPEHVMVFMHGFPFTP